MALKVKVAFVVTFGLTTPNFAQFFKTAKVRNILKNSLRPGIGIF